MKIQLLDIIVIIAYLILVSVIGIVLKKQAQRSKNDYLLGGKSMPYWMLGVSNASGMFDISGTAWMVAIMFIYGVKSIWLPWLWPVFNQIFMMVYMSIWLRRSNVSTGAEWMLTRFGTNKDAQLSHKIIIAFALLSCLGFMAYGFIGLGKFIEIFIPWDIVKGYVPFEVAPEYVAHLYGIIFTLFTVFYSLLGGMKSIVWADLIHYVIMVFVSFAVAIIAMQALSNHLLIVPKGWNDIFFGKELNLDWSGIINEVNTKITSDGFSPFGYFFALMTAKGILSSLAGPAPNYDMQKVLSTKSPREAALMSMIVNVVLLPTRYLLIIGITVLGLLFFKDINISTATGSDFERILPAALNTFIPSGLLGLILVGLMGAFMGTFAGTFNAAQAYMVNDIYLKSINPNASNKQVARMNYITGLVVVFISIMLGFFAKDVNSILQWIVSALYGGYIAANVLKWHWWRFNSYGFFWGMFAGIASSMILPTIFTDALPLYYFPIILLLSIIGSVAGSLLTPATDTEVLKSFYKNIRPWGFWKPIDELVKAEDPTFEANREFKSDMFNVLVGTIAQTAITALPVYVVLLMPMHVGIAAIILGLCAFILWKTWYKKLPND
ncbi:MULTISPECIES: sodium:solute symporter family protein [unclassified Arcicella]|uniref:sodium:solute symporter family protein n=1 Tax=unclassified Arcicella TaxID=2644986 RepID=UPI0028552396|nr:MULTISPECIES: sodium:solute symporter family protein [unclassified Arcicella]MDR6562953.1 Na+/proline symporter [Arcicella sp. BE51]MDR6813037.1 Na+/proline symporter [Arcicella sp. BE140]MDR6824351.1 Na+/proline symporter [Arcicella sp. BE139]